MKKYIGIYASKNNLQLVVLAKGLTKARLIAADSIKIPADVSLISAPPSAVGEKNLPPLNVEKPQRPKTSRPLTPFETTVAEFLKKHNIKEGEIVATALPPELIVIRYFQMPRLAPAEHKTAVPFEARKYLPYKLKDTVYAYSVSYEKVALNKMAVTFVAAEKTSVYKYIKFFENVGLKVGFLEAITYSLARFLYHTKDAEPHETLALIHIGRESANINLIRNMNIYLSRNVLFAGKSTQALAIDTAVLDSLLVETRLSFDYFHRQFPEERIEKMVIWSDDKAIQGWGQNAGKDMNVPVKVCNPLDAIEGAQGCSVEYSVGCGLALRGFVEPYKDINLSPTFKRLEIERLVRLAVFEISLAITVLFMFYTLGMGKVQVLQNQLNKIVKQRPNVQLGPEEPSKQNIESVKSQVQSKFESLQYLVDSKLYLVSKLNTLSQLLPEGLWLNELNFARQKGKTNFILTLKGYAYNRKGQDQIKVINKFLEDLKSSPEFCAGFAAIKLDSISNEKYLEAPTVSFQASCTTE